MKAAALLPLFLAVACSEPQPPAPLPAPPPPAPAPGPADGWTKYSSLLGDWVDSTSSARYRVYEHWQVVNDSTFDGHGYVLTGKDTVFVEDLMLAHENGQVTYSARIDSRNEGEWVPFTALASGTDSLMFENPGHDFPQCILYVRDSIGRWNVRVNGVEKGREREERSLYSRRGV